MNSHLQHSYLPGWEDIEIVTARRVALSVPRHIHSSYCIGILEEGFREFEIHGKCERITAGDVLLVNPGEVHSFTTPSGTSQSYAILSLPASTLEKAAVEFLGRRCAALRFSVSAADNNRLFRVFQELLSLLRRTHARLEQDEAYLNILTAIFADGVDSANQPSSSPANDQTSTVIVREYLEAYYSREIPLTELARTARVSPSHLVRRFTKNLGIPPHTYQTLLRLKQARVLLKSGRSLADTALQTGFYDQSHFTHAFKKFNGAPPGAFLKEVILS